MIKNWYILKIQKGFESIVKTDIETILRQKNLINKIDCIIIPTSIKNNKIDTITITKYSPSFIFIKMEYNNKILSLIRKINNVIKFITKNKQPIEIDKKEIRKLISKLNTNEYSQETNTNYSIDDNIRIKKGPFFDYIGKITYIDHKKKKIRIKILVFGRTTLIDLDFTQVEKE